MRVRTYTVLHLFSGCRFRTLTGVDIDPAGCRDFDRLTGIKSTQADIAEMRPADLVAACGGKHPDVIFLSPPCTGFSGLLGEAKSKAPKYQALNSLVLKGLFLALEAFRKDPPSLILLENIPRIQQRGAELLDQAERLMAGYGYVFARSTHDCGEIGGMGQHRPRFLLVARLPKRGAWILSNEDVWVAPTMEAEGTACES